ncbi:MAG: diacylglycerol kinase [Alphaproteobacteria bacterium]|nr:diacylglycerol kinase [Alphaproteobacteria bacterium]
MGKSAKPKNNAGLKRVYNAFFFSVDGLKSSFKTEAAFRQEVALMIVAIPLALWLGQTPVEKVLLISSLLFILIAELVNTAIECAIDRISLEKHELSKNAKDVGSAIVLIALINAVITWALLLI